MTHKEISAIEKYYEKLYGLPKDDTEAINILLKVYKQLFKLREISNSDHQGIAEYYRNLRAKDLPAYVWMLEAFHSVSKKNPNKQSFNYIVGILRQWMLHGFGHMPSQEDDEIMSYFLEVTKLSEASIEAKRMIKNLMGTYGLIKVTRMIGELSSQDISKLFTNVLMDLMNEKYGKSTATTENASVTIEEKVEIKEEIQNEDITSTVTEAKNPPFNIAEVVNFKLKVKGESQNKDKKQEKANSAAKPAEYVSIQVRNSPEYREQLLKESILIEDILRDFGKPIRFSDLQKKTIKQISWGSNPHSKMDTYLKYNNNIYKHSKGIYATR